MHRSASSKVLTMPGKGDKLALRLGGALEPWFDQSWQPGRPPTAALTVGVEAGRAGRT
jgi:hypothetical protein